MESILLKSRPLKIFLVENEPSCINQTIENLFKLRLLHQMFVTTYSEFIEVFNNLGENLIPDLILIRNSEYARNVIKYLKASEPYGKIPIVVVITEENEIPDDYGADFYVDNPLEAKVFWKIVARIPNVFLCFVDERAID